MAGHQQVQQQRIKEVKYLVLDLQMVIALSGINIHLHAEGRILSGLFCL